MLINCLLLLPAIILNNTFLPNVSATPDTLDNVTLGNETNLSNSTILSNSSTTDNHTSVIEPLPIPPPRAEDFGVDDRVIF